MAQAARVGDLRKVDARGVESPDEPVGTDDHPDDCVCDQCVRA